MKQTALQTQSPSYEYYLQEAANDDDDDPLIVAISPTINNKQKEAANDDCSGLFNAVMSPAINSSQSILSSPLPTECRSFLNGLLSPFSPLLKQSDMRGEYLQYVSLQTCRKVTCVVKVLPLGSNENKQRCLFPQLKSDNASLPQNVVVVNPSAFGKHIPSHVTLETARLVSRATDTSDWARLYNLHHVVWPTEATYGSSEQTNDQTSIDSLSRAIAQDAMVELQSSVIISLGEEFDCGGSDDGLWTRVMTHCEGLIEEKMVCTISFVEILDGRDRFRDLLLDGSEQRQNGGGSIGIRHVDMKLSSTYGAILENLTQVPIDAMPGMVEAIVRRKDPSSTVIGTISLWDNAISHELEKSPDSQITCVEMATFRGQSGAGKVSSENRALGLQGSVSLGRALRQLLLHASVGTDPLSKDYEATLGTLNYLRRLLIKPGEAVSSPFRNRDTVQEHLTSEMSEHSGGVGTPSNRLYEYAHSPQMLEQIVADPRQRLARLFKQSSPMQICPKINYAPSEDDYEPIDYMDYNDENEVYNERNHPEKRSNGENMSKVVNSDYGIYGHNVNLALSSESRNYPFDALSGQETSQASTSRNVVWFKNRYVNRFEQEHNVVKTQFDHMLDADLTASDIQNDVGTPICNQPTRSDVTTVSQRRDVSPELFTKHSTDIHDKAGIKDGMARGCLPLRDYPTHNIVSEEQTVEYQANRSKEYRTDGLGLEVEDSMAPPYGEYNNVAELDESSSSTLGSTFITGDGFNTTVASFTPSVENNQEILGTSCVPHNEKGKGHWDHRGAFKNMVEAQSEQTDEMGVLKDEVENIRRQDASHEKKHQEDLKRLQYQLDQAIEVKGHVEKITEEAISSQGDIEKHLLFYQNELSTACDNTDNLRKEKLSFFKEREEFHNRFESMGHVLQTSENAKRLDALQRHKLQLAIEEMKGEQNSLKRSLRDNEQIICALKNEKQQTDRDLEELRKEKLELMVVLQEKDREIHGVLNQTEALRSSLEVVEREKLKTKDLHIHEKREVSMLKKKLQNMALESTKLKSTLIDRDATLGSIQDSARLFQISKQELQSRIKVLELERDQLKQKTILEDKELHTMRENLIQMNLSIQELTKECGTYEQLQRDHEVMISALEHELSAEKARRSLLNSEREEVAIELQNLKKGTTEMETENTNLEKYNLELLKSLEESKKAAQSNIRSLGNKNQELGSKLRECAANLSACENEKKAIIDQLESVSMTVYTDVGGADDLSRESLLYIGFDDRTNLEVVLADYKEKMNADFVRFRSTANKDLRTVRVHYEKVVQESEELQSKFMGMEERVFLLKKENAKLRYHRKKCLNGLRNGRDHLALISGGGEKPASTTDLVGRQSPTSGPNAFTVVPELYLTKSSMDFPGGWM
ncbi:MAG: hypothetical protein SGBAC_010121 [Bacillariaceae sp.]